MSIKTKISGVRAVMAFDNWPALVLGRLFYRKTGLVVYCKNNLEILVDHRGGDEAGTRDCIVSDHYRKYVPQFKLCGPAHVLDIGANGGGFPLMLTLEGVKLASLVSVEMNPATYSRLLVNLQNNIGRFAVAINAAACGKDTGPEILLVASPGGVAYSMYENTVGPNAPHIAVKTTTLESLYSQYFAGRRIDVCKIDIEGAEYDLLDSSPDDLLRKIRYLLIEFHDDSRTPAVISRFVTLGFSELTKSGSRTSGGLTEVRCFRGPEADL
jgi:FkbM family methyltransferase